MRLQSVIEANRGPVRLRSAIGNVIVDRANGIIANAAIITAGEAKGHPFSIDRVSMAQIVGAITDRGGTLPVRCTHPDDGQDGLPTTVGQVRNVRLEGSSVRGDVYLLSHAPGREHLLDVAESMPTEIGVSLEFPADGFSIAESSGALVLRVTRVDAADLVGRPAANPNGLLAAGDETMAKQPANNNDTPTAPAAETPASDAASGGVSFGPEAIAALRKALSIPDDIPDDGIEDYLKIKAAEARQAEDALAAENEAMNKTDAAIAAMNPPVMTAAPAPVLAAGSSGKTLTMAEAEKQIRARDEAILGSPLV